MTTPVAADVHVDVMLTQVSEAYRNEDYIAEKIFPEIKVKKDTDNILTYGTENIRGDDDIRLPGKRAKGFEITMSNAAAYKLVEHAREAPIIWSVRDNQDAPINYESDVTEMLRENQKAILEINTALAMNTSTNFTTNTTPGNGKWTLGTSDPIADVDNLKDTIFGLCGKEANTVVVTQKMFRLLRRNPKLMDMYKYTKGGRLTLNDLREAFEIENFLVAKPVKVSTKEGQTVTLSSIWTDANVQVLYVAPKPGLMQLSYGYTYRKIGYPFMDRWVESANSSDCIRVNDKYDSHVQKKDCGALITGCL